MSDPAFIRLADGRVAIVDRDCYPILSHRKWYVTNGYASNQNGGHGNVIVNFMHREVMRLHGIEIPAGKEIDHINHNRLDNRFENLRVCDRSLNNANRPYTNTTGFRGVYQRESGKFRGRVQLKGRTYFTKTFDTPEEAAKARDELALSIQGDFATLNY